MCDSVMNICDNDLCGSCDSTAAGFDFEGGSYVGLFQANERSAVINIPIVEDLNSNEGTEFFIVHLSAHSVISDNLVISLGIIREATVYIQDEIVISFLEKYMQVKEGGNITLTVNANTPSDQDFTINVNVTSDSGHCKLKYILPTARSL